MEVGKVGGECERKPSYCGSEAVDEIGAGLAAETDGGCSGKCERVS